MAFNRPTLQQIVDRIVADLVAKITGATMLALRSVLLIIGKVYAGAVHLLYGYIDNQSKELFVSTATADSAGGKLDTHGGEFNVLRTPAAAATGSITCTGVAATLIPAGSSLVSPAGNRYTTNANATIGGGGSIVVAVTCDTAGTAGNDNAGITLTFESPIAGVNSTATVGAAGLSGGAAEESDDAYRSRVLRRKQLTPHGGADFDLESWALEVAGVTRAWAYPGYYGLGTVALFFVCDGQSPITPTAAQIAAVRAHLLSHTDEFGNPVGVPVTMRNGLFVLAPTLRSFDYTIKLSPNTSAVQTAASSQIADFLLREGFPANTMYLSNLDEAISAASGEERHQVVGGSDQGMAYNEVAVLGAVTWQNY